MRRDFCYNECVMFKFPHQVVKLIKALKEHQFEAYVVGGAVRDIMLGKLPHDYDIATSATPDDSIAIAKEHGWQTVDKLGKNFGTIIVVVNGMGMEVTTFRGERYDKDSHRPAEIWKARNLQEDCKRRDFTVNAMAMDLQGILYDFNGGRKDLENQVLRTVGKAKKRFSEDALRMFRACRFVAELGFDYVDENSKTHKFGDPNSEYYLPRCPVFDVSRCDGLSVERVKAELEKLFCGDFAGKGLAMLMGTGLATAKCQVKKNGEVNVVDILPELTHLVGLKQNPKFHFYDAWEHTLRAIDNSPSKLAIRWALVCHDIGKGMPGVRDINKEGQPRDSGHEKQSAIMTAELLQRLNYAPKFVKYVTFLVAHHMRFAGFMRDDHNGIKAEKSMLHWLRDVVSENLFKHETDLADACTDLVKLYLADMGATVAGRNAAIMAEGREMGAQLIQLARTRMPISTGDLNLKAQDIEKIPADVNVKNALNYLVHRVQSGDLVNEHTALMKALFAKYERLEKKKHEQDVENRSARAGSGGVRRRTRTVKKSSTSVGKQRGDGKHQ